MKESHQKAMPMIHLDRSHKLTQEYLALYAELGKRQQAAEKSARKSANG
jgi:hypothetical protein